MGILRHLGRGEHRAVPDACLIGRSPDCALQLDDAQVSSQHAHLRWDGTCWSLRDLGSLNGTWVDGSRLEPGRAVTLAEGAELRFASDTQAWVLEDASAPEPAARDLTTGELHLARHGVLGLPTADEPDVVVYRDPDGAWVLEGDSHGATADGAVVTVRGTPWRLHLPSASSGTVRADPVLDDVSVDLWVSRDEEHVVVTLEAGGRRWEVPSRSHHYTLLLLARRRLETAGAVGAQQGWMDVDELRRMLRCEENKLNVDVFRIRRDFGKFGIQSPATVITRQRTQRRLRLELSRLTIRREGEASDPDPPPAR
jgi:hypothetical protein